MIDYSDAFSLPSLLSPKSIALVGASKREGSFGAKVLGNLLDGGYRGTVYPVNPRYDNIEGMACYSSLEALPEAPECVALALPADGIYRAFDQAVDVGAKAAVIYSSGFAEVQSGRHLQRRLEASAAANDVALCGPNCLGVYNLHDQVCLYSPAPPRFLRPGRVGLISQTGSGCIALTSAGTVGFSFVISSGNEAVLTAEDYALFLAHDDNTDVIAMVVETLRQPKRLARAAALAAERGKRIVVLKVGWSSRGAVAAQAHTGSIVGDHSIFAAFCERSGIVVVNDLDEMLDQCALLSSDLGTPSGGLGVLTISGGQAAMFCDHAEQVNVPLADLDIETVADLRSMLPAYVNVSNPLDVGGAGVGAYETYERCLDALLKDPNVGAVLVSQDAPLGMHERQCGDYLSLIERIPIVRNRVGKPVVFGTHTSGPLHPRVAEVLAESAIPVIYGTRRSAVALSEVFRSAKTPGEDPFPDEGENRKGPRVRTDPKFEADRMLHPIEVRRLLRQYGVRLPAQELVATPEAAQNAAEALDGPATVKLAGPMLFHKTELRGVCVGVVHPETVAEVAREMLQEAGERGDPVWGVLIEETLADDGLDVFIGVRNSEGDGYGPSVAVGPGGTLLELMRDHVRVDLLPRDEGDANHLIDRTNLKDLLGGWRGSQALDRNALVQILMQVSQLVIDHSDRIRFIDFNPVRVFPAGLGAVVLDAKLIVDQEGSQCAGLLGN